MQIEFHQVPESIAIVRDWFTPQELEMVWAELDVVCSPFILNGSGNARAATSPDGTVLKNGHGIFLDHFYGNRRQNSNILTLNKKLFDKSFMEALIAHDPVFQYFIRSNADSTLVNYYEDDGRYNTHFDSSVYTSNIVLWREPKSFRGGEFLLTDKEINFNLKSNDLIIFPGYMLHRVTGVKMNRGFTPWKSGRYSLTNFIYFQMDQ